MRKTILFGLSVLFALTSQAQLSVDSLGRMTLSPQKTTSFLGVQQTTSGYSETIRPIGTGGLLIKREIGDNRSSQYGINVEITASGQTAAGVSSQISGSSSNLYCYGIRGIASGAYSCFGVYGGLTGTPSRGYGIYGGTTSAPSLLEVPTGIYAGYFRGDLKVSGTIYGTLVSPSSVSSPSDGGTTTNLSEQSVARSESITEKLQQVDLLQMERMNQNGSLPANKVEEKRMLAEEERAELGEDVDHAGDEPIQTRLSDISYGLAADQLQKVFPELVYEDAEGNYCINYVEMVPLLVQSIRELSAEVTELKQKLGISDPAKSVMRTKGKAEDADNVTLLLSDKSQEATLNIYDLNGRLLRTTSVDGTSVSLSSHTRGLPAGTYAYSLVVNGKKQKARKVVVK